MMTMVPDGVEVVGTASEAASLEFPPLLVIDATVSTFALVCSAG